MPKLRRYVIRKSTRDYNGDNAGYIDREGERVWNDNGLMGWMSAEALALKWTKGNPVGFSIYAVGFLSPVASTAEHHYRHVTCKKLTDCEF